MLLAGAAALRPPATPGALLLFSHSPSSFSSTSFTVSVDGSHSNRGLAVSIPMARVNGMVTGVAIDPEDDEWLQNKPAGFGEGKNYETTVEDELMEEMERSRKALLASISKKKKDAMKRAERINEQDRQISSKVTDVIPSGIRVRVWNLPRKKNIHRDLQLAFQGFRGILHISPAVIANQKTRDPVCKGFAFLVLESEHAAKRFVQTYTKQNVIFGKVQKQVMCDIVNTRTSTDSSDEQFGDDTTTFSQPMSDNFRDVTTSRPHSHHIPLDHIDNFPEGSSSGGLAGMTEQEYTWAMKDKYQITSHSEETERGLEDSNGSVMNNHDRKQTTLKKKKIKAKPKNASKLSIPGLTSR
ncbi:Nucleotide-binding alpha-beta plait domain-containing protein [Dioscorea alata]|nr:Nucleotide-binding alpha-beta plait domain-containing protein [Dioscorea alata]